MRAMPQPTRTFRWLAQVTTPRDGLPDPSSLSIATEGMKCAIRPHARSPRAQCNAAPRNDNSGRPSEPWVSGSPRCSGFQQEDIIDAKNGCSRGKLQKTLHKSGVVSRVPRRSRHAQRSGRTETLTGQATHTSSKAATKRTRNNEETAGELSDRPKQFEPDAPTAGDLRPAWRPALLALLTARSASTRAMANTVGSGRSLARACAPSRIVRQRRVQSAGERAAPVCRRSRYPGSN